MKNAKQLKVDELSSKEKVNMDGGWPSIRELVHDAVHELFGICNGAEEH